MNEFIVLLKMKYGLRPDDVDIASEKDFEGMTPAQAVAWLGEKYNLVPMEGLR